MKISECQSWGYNYIYLFACQVTIIYICEETHECKLAVLHSRFLKPDSYELKIQTIDILSYSCTEQHLQQMLIQLSPYHCPAYSASWGTQLYNYVYMKTCMHEHHSTIYIVAVQLFMQLMHLHNLSLTRTIFHWNKYVTQTQTLHTHCCRCRLLYHLHRECLQ